MPVLFDFDEKTINTTLLCPASREYLANPQIDPKLSSLIENLDSLEKTYQAQTEDAFKKAKIKTNKMILWLSGAFITTVLLFAAATLLVQFFPPAAALILPIFTAIGSWLPLLVLTTFLPSAGLGIASLFALRSCNKIKTTLEISKDLSKQLEHARNHIMETIPHHSSMKSSIENELERLVSSSGEDASESLKTVTVPRRYSVFNNTSSQNIEDSQNTIPTKQVSKSF